MRRNEKIYDEFAVLFATSTKPALSYWLPKKYNLRIFRNIKAWSHEYSFKRQRRSCQ